MDNNILIGPNLQHPPSAVSFGKKIYGSMLKASPEEVIFIDAASGKQTTYKEFFTLCCRLARSLQNFGCKADDVISISSENNELYFVPVVASLFLGITASPLNHTYTQRELSHLVDIVRPKIVFCSKQALPSFVQQRLRATFIEKIIVLDSELAVDGYETMTEFINKHCERNFHAESFEPVDVNPFDHVAAIMCSSGTTGMPKGVMVTHDNISMRTNQIMDPRLYSIGHETICACLPFFHAYGFMMIITGIPLRSTYVIMQRFEEEKFLQAIERYKINVIHIVPPIAHFLAKSPLPLKYDLSSLKDVLVGAAPLSQDIEAIIHRRYPTIKAMRQGYGLTEGTMALILMPAGEKRIGSSGKIVPGMLAYIRDIETGKPLGRNETGELCFKGRLVTKGYYRNPEETERTYVDGWLCTGDLGYYDEEDYFFIVDRLKELIKYKGFQVPPAELEGILLAHPKIKDVGVVGKPDEVAGELPTAFIVKSPGTDLTANEVIEYLATQVSKPKQLHGGVRFVDAIPKNASGKIMRRVLKETLTNQKSKL